MNMLNVQREIPDDLLKNILTKACALGASDIHFDPDGTKAKVRMRIHGRLRMLEDLSSEIYHEILIRIKIACGLKIDDHQNPKDGSFEIIIDNKKISARISMLPTSHGENIVLRIYKNEGISSLLQIGFKKEDSKMILLQLSKPGSIGIVMGPTGSGKTTTLYALLHDLKKEDVMAVTVEDPVESDWEGVRQIPVSATGTINFSNALRSILRQDPDLILIGEIRDYETALLAFQAALTGHVVITSIHAYNLKDLVPRLHSLGVPDYLLRELRILLINQRLIEKLCSACKLKRTITADERKKIAMTDLLHHFESPGCADCHQTGIEGRILAYEIEGEHKNLRDGIVSLILSSEISLESASIYL